MSDTKTPTVSAETATDVQAAASLSPVAARVAELRQRSRQDPEGARDEAWAWIEELGRRARTDRDAAAAELQEMFETGGPATGIDGQTKGILVATFTAPAVDRALGAITDSWMPWLGKKFFPAQEKGINTLTDSARWPAKLLWPLYSTGDDPKGRSAFEFTTYVEAGKLDPQVQVLVIDYESVPANPALLIKQIRDELVEVVPGANLGKMLVRLPRRGYVNTLYFALKSDV